MYSLVLIFNQVVFIHKKLFAEIYLAAYAYICPYFADNSADFAPISMKISVRIPKDSS